jgi:hypothetical protein
MKFTVTTRETCSINRNALETPSGKPDRDQIAQGPGQPGWLRQAKLGCRSGMAALLAMGALCLPETGLASPGPTFSTNPTSQSVAAGSTATFTVAATGSPSYQWYSAYNGATNLLAGATGTSLGVAGYYTNQGNYFCVASNAGGTATSTVVTLGVSYGWTTYGYTSGWQYFSVPYGVTNLAVDAIGTGGGTGGNDSSVGGYGSGNRARFWGVVGVTDSGSVAIGLGSAGGGGNSSVDCSGGGGGGFCPWGGQGGSGGNAGCSGTSGGGGGGGAACYFGFPSSLSYPALVLGGAGGGGGGGINGSHSGSSAGGASADLLETSGYNPSAYSGGTGGGCSCDGGGGGGAGGGAYTSVGGGIFGTGDYIGGGGAGGYSFIPNDLVPIGNTYVFGAIAPSASAGQCAFRPAPLARISMPGTTVTIASGQSLSMTVQFFTQDTVNSVTWYRNGVAYSTSTVTSLGNYAYNSTLARGTGYTAGEVWTVYVTTSYNSDYGNTVSPVAISTPTSVTVLLPPSITGAPANQTAISTSNVLFSVTATGAAPLTYQWSFDTSAISGATNTSLSLTGIRVTNAGSYTVVISNSVGSVTSSPAAILTVNKATPAISGWPSASAITYSQTLSASTLAGGSASVGGAFAFTTPSTTPAVGTYSASVTFTPSDTANYNTVAGTVNVSVGTTTPVVSAWPAATGLTYGQTLSASTLSGGTASVGGSFAFAAPGTVPGAGTYYATVVFTPTTPADYNSVTNTVKVVVGKASPSVTAWPVAGAITYGQELSASTLTSGSATPAGAFTFVGASTIPFAGTHSETLIYTPTDTADYNNSVGIVSVTVLKATPTVTTWPTATGIVYGQPLAASILSGGSASAIGSFTFNSPSNVPNAGSYRAAVTFTPSDTIDYNSVSGTVSEMVAQAAQVVTLQLQVSDSIPLNQFTNPVPIMVTSSSGLPVSLSLSNGSVATLDSSGTNLVSIGATGIVTILADQAGDSNYLAATEVVGSFDVTLLNQTITFSPIPPQVTTNLAWPLSATSDSGLTVVFSLISGPATLDTNLGVLSFTGAGSVVVQAGQPGDAINYNPAVPVMQAVQVSLAVPMITWSALPTSTYGDAPFALDGSSSSTDSVTYTSWNTNVAVVQGNVVTIVGAGTAVISLQDSGDGLFTPDTAQEVLTVIPATPALSVPTASSIIFGQSLASSTLSAGSANLGPHAVAGSFAFADSSIVPGAGTYAACVVFTPSDTTDYISVKTNVNVVVVPSVPSILNLPAAGPITFGQSLSASTLIAGSASVSGSFAFANSSVIPSGAGEYAASLIFTPSDTNYSSVSTTVEVEVNQATPSIGSWPTATSFNYGNPLSVSSLVGGSSTPAGAFTFSTPAEILNVGLNYVSVVFTPNDTADYTTVTGTVAVQVAQGLVEITVLPTASPITFGQSLASSSLSGGNATVGGSFAFANSSIVPSTAGIYSAVVSYTPTNSNYPVITTNVAVAVNKAIAVVVLTNLSQNYDGTAKSVTATTTPPGLTVTMTYNGSSTQPVTAGSYSVNATVNDTNYSGAATGTLFVGKVPLVVAAQGMTRRYGVTNSPYTAVINGFATGDTLSSLSGSLIFTVEDTNNNVLSVDTNTPTASYTIIPSGLGSSNYSITYTNATLLILPAILTVSAQSVTNVYGAAMPPLTWSYQGFMNGEGTNVLTGAPVLSTNLTSGSPVAGSPYAITITNGTLSASNYVFSFNYGTFTVLPALLTISADNQTKVYGATLPALTASYAGFVNGDTSASLTTLPTLATPATASSHVNGSPYGITASGAVDSNYTISYASGALTVTTGSLMITANNQTKVYGAALPALTASYSGFVNGDTSANLTTSSTLATTATASSHMSGNPYSITASGAVDADYAIGYTSGTLTLTKAPLLITADNQTKVYGAALPALTASYAGFVNGDTSASLLTLPALATTATAGSHASGSPYSITASGAFGSDYAISYAGGTLTVTSGSLMITANNQTKAYGASLPTLTASYAGFVNGDTSASLTTLPTLATPATASSAVSTYSITASAAVDSDYTIGYASGTLSITTVPLTITAVNQSREYGQTNPTFTFSYSGLVNGDTAANLTVLPSATCTATPTTTRGSYPITAAGAASGNYTLSYVNGTLTVTPAPLVVVGNNASRPYGTTNPVFTATITGIMNNDNITAKFSTTATTNSVPGGYIIQLSLNDPTGKLGQYSTTLNSGILTVSGAILIGQVMDVSRAYGETNPVFTVSYSGFVNGQNSNVISGDLSFACTDTNDINVDTNTTVGEYPILVANGQTAPNYIIDYTNGTLTVTQAVLTVAANATNRVYGAANPAFTSTITGYVNGEDSNVLSGALMLTSVAGATNPVGAYPIVPSGVTATNYSINFTNGALTVTQAPLFVGASNASRLYGQSNPSLTGSVVGLLNNDNLGITFVTPATPASAVGNYSIVPAFADPDHELSNYQLTTNNGTLTVGQAPLSVVAANQTRVYGQSNPTLTGTVTGVMNGDNITASYSTTATAASPVGSYSIVPSINDPQSKLGNYAVTPSNGTLTVTTAPLLITANNQTRVYGAANPSFSAAYNGFVNGDTASVLVGTLSVTSPATAASPAGNYAIIPSGLSGSNYLIAYANGTLTVTPALLTVSANPATRTYGTTNPVLTATFSGFVNGDTTNVISGQPVLNAAADPHTPVGTRNIFAGLGTLSAANYGFSFSNGTLTITPASLTGTVQNADRAYGLTNPVFSVIYQGFVLGQDSSLVSGPIGFSCLDTNNVPVDTNTFVGAYPIQVTTPQTAPNYNIGYVAGTLSVTQAVLTVSADPQSRVYGTTNPVLTVSFSGFANGDGTNVISGQPDLSTVADMASAIGNYDIVVGLGSLSATNYSFSLTNGTLTVGKALLTVTADNQSRLYGQTNPVFTVHYSGFVDGDTQSVLSGAPALSTAAITNTPVGAYSIVAATGSLTAANYALSYVNGTLTINPASLSIAANNASRQYGATNPIFTVTMEGFVNGENATALSGTLSVTSSSGATNSVGSYAIVPSGLSSTNYALSYTNGTLTVTQALLTVTANSTNRIYGQANPVFTGSNSGTLNGDNLGISFGSSATPSSPVAQYSILPVFADLGNKFGNYLVTTNLGTLTVSPALLTVTADDQTRAYGQQNPTLTVEYSGFANADGPTSLTVQPTGSTEADATYFIGQYPITVSGGVSSNYTFSYIAGTLNVQQANLTVIGDNAARAYGQTNPVFTSTITGLANGDDITASYSCQATLTSQPGGFNIDINLNDPNGVLGEYNLTLVSGMLTVTNAALIVTADNQNRLYGQANPPFTVQYSGFVNGQSTNVLHGTLKLTCLDGSNKAVGTNTAAGSYPITASGLTGSNYTISYVAGTLAIAPAPLNVTAMSAQRVYGATNPIFAATISGFVNGQSSNVLSGTLSVTSPANAASPTGTYAIIPSGLTSGNYALSFNNGTLTVTPATLTGTVWNVARAYGQTNPMFGVTYQGFVNGQHRDVLSGTLAFSCLDTNNDPVNTNTTVGVYPILVVTPQTGANYNIGYVAGSLSVTQAVLTVSADPQSRLYGTTNPVLTVTYSGFANGENTNVISGQPSLSTVAEISSPVGGYDIVVGPGSLSATNYSFSLTNGTLTVGKALLLVTADNQSRLYGQTNPVLTFQYSGFVDGDTESVLSGAPALSTVACTNTPPGAYNIVVTNGTLTATNYALGFVNGSLTINPAPLSITANDASRQYGTTNPVFTVTMLGFANGEDATVLSGTLSITSSTDPTSSVGTYAIVPAGLNSANYAVTYANGTLTVTQALLTVTANSAISQYGSPTPLLGGTISGLLNGDPITANYTTAATQSSPAGSYAIVSSLNDPASKAPNYSVTYVNGTLTINVASLVVTVDNQNRLYGQTNPPFTVHYSGFTNGDGINALQGALIFSCLDGSSNPAGTNTAVGSYPISATGLSSSNYSIAYVAGTLAIAKAPLNVSALSAQRVYGSTNPVFTATISGFVNGETASVLSGTLSVTSAANHHSPIGTYAIIPSGLTSGNYSLSYNDATLTVTPATLTGTVSDVARAYGQTNPVFGVSYSGFVNGQHRDILAGTLGFSCLDTNGTPVDTNTPVGVYPIQVVTPQTAANYNIGYVDGALSVTQAVLTVSADHQSRLYGATNPVLTVTYSGFANGENTNVISGQPNLSTAATNDSPIGDYAIVIGPGSLSATNYSFILTNGTLTVCKALLAVTADNQSRLYGQTNPVLTVHYTGFVDGDTASVLSGAPALSTTACTNTTPGAYNIVVTNGTLTATNYALSFVNGTLTISPAPLSITANCASRLYGASNPMFTFTMQGFVNGEHASALSGSLSLSSATWAGSPVGAYAIVPSGLTSSNYAISYINGTLTITQAPLTVTANNASSQYGTPIPAFSGTISGLLNGDPITAIYTTSATQASPAGSYAIVPSLNDPDSLAPNYAVTFVNGTLTITVAFVPTATPVFYVVGNPPVFIDTNASVADGSNLNFGGGSLTVTIVTNACTNDALGIKTQGNGSNQINVQSTTITDGGSPIATFSGGNGLNPLVILFNTNATAQSATALMRCLTFATPNTSTNSRVIQMNLTVGGNTVMAEYVFTLDRPPVASNTIITAAQGQTIQIPFSQVLTNDSDADGDTLTIGDFSDLSANGGFVTTNDMTFTYTPPEGLTGQDRFAYIVVDGRGGEAVGSIIINFMPVNQIHIDASKISSTGAELIMAGIPGEPYLIQASTDLLHWVNLSTVTANEAGIIQLLDAAAVQYPHRFYRAIEQ